MDLIFELADPDYSGSQNCPNVLLFWIDWLGVKR